MSSSRLSWFLVGAAAVALASCSSSNNVCDTKVCQPAPDGGASAEVCNPKDGLCYCGVNAVAGSDGGAGVLCQTGTTCDPASQTCVSVLCTGKVCGDTGTCDPTDGVCKCGGVPCINGATCDNLSGTCVPPKGICETKSCAANLVCDPSDGNCKCYVGGPACGSTQICNNDGGCIDDPCFGVTCTATGAACYGGTCKCGGANGVECSTPGNSCSPIDNSCGPTASCAITPCAQPGTVCNPTDPIGSQCHCGTIAGQVCPTKEYCQIYLVDGGPLAPFEDAGGAPIYGQCKGNNPCSGVTCPPFELCDDNNFDPKTGIGRCECGGDPAANQPGPVCASDEVCIVAYDGGPSECLPTCQPFGTPCASVQPPDDGGVDAGIPGIIPYGCYYFETAHATACAAQTSDAGANANCVLATDCSASAQITCAGFVTDGGQVFHPPTCLPYCDVFPAGGPTSTPPPDGGTAVCQPGLTCVPLDPGIVAGICE